ncbi:dodecin [Rhodococcus koreensis]
MSDHVYRVVEVVGSSSDGTDQAIKNAIARTNDTVRNVEWFEVVETRGHVENGAIAHYQVTVKVGFRVEPGDAV